MIIKQNVFKVMIKIEFMMKELIFMKKIGNVPKNNPIVVSPNASPGVFFKVDTSIPKVVDIVILNSKIPIKDIHMI